MVTFSLLLILIIITLILCQFETFNDVNIIAYLYISIPVTPVKPAPSNSSPLGTSNSPIVQSPDLPTSSTTGTKRVGADRDSFDRDTDGGEYNIAMYALSPRPS